MTAKLVLLVALHATLLFVLPVSGESLLSPDELQLQVEMPDPLTDRAGHMVTDLNQWEDRRAEMKRILEHDGVGEMPPAPPEMLGEVTGVAEIMDGDVRCQWVQLRFGPQMKLGFEMLFLAPRALIRQEKIRPVVVIPSSARLPGRDGAEEFAGSYQAALKSGYGVATFYYQDVAVDSPDARRRGLMAAYPDQDWGTLAAWAWGMSRCVDWLETEECLSGTKWIAAGHSRLGKAALIAGAFDERFALTAAAGSGCGGTAAYRYCGKGRGGKEGLEDAVARFPQWFGPRLAGFSGKVERLPFDQHWFIAMIAPRCFIAADATADPYTNVVALQKSIEGAMPVFDLLGVSDHLAFHLRPGGHELAAADWQAILEFSDKKLVLGFQDKEVD